jgi:HEAT repeat protein
MKPKVAIPILAIGLLVLLPLFLLRQRSGALNHNQPSQTADQQPDPGASIAAPRTDSSTDAGEKSKPSPTITAGTSPEPDQPAAESAGAKHEAYVAERVAQLQDLAMENDSPSLDTILAELTNRDPEIRKAALEAAVQFGGRDAIPKLEDVASQTDDAHEKAALADAIEFLKLPSLSEVEAQSPAPGAGQVKPAGTRAFHRKARTPSPSPTAPE